MAFELERLGQAGITTLTPFDEHYPRQVRRPARGGCARVCCTRQAAVELLDNPGVGVVGSRNVSPDGAEVAGAVSRTLAARHGSPADLRWRPWGRSDRHERRVRGAGGGVVGVLAESLVRKLRSPDVRRAIHEGRTVMCTPYNPEAPFSVGNAMGRNRLIYALVRASPSWSPAKWTRAAPGRARSKHSREGSVEWPCGEGRVRVLATRRLEERGGVPVTTLDELEAAVLEPEERAGVERLQADRPSPAPQPTLFD